MVIWFVGLSGSGKTTMSRLLYERLKPTISNLVLIDGDVIREIFANDTGYTVEDRLKNAHRISHLCKMLSDQGINVIAAVLSIFPEWQRWNRENLNDYRQIYLRVPMDVLSARQKSGLYRDAAAGKIKNVVGVDIPFPEPLDSDLILDNAPNRQDFSDLMERVMSLEPILKLKA